VLASRLIAEGATVRGWDPVALEEAREMLPGITLTDDLREALKDADAAVIVTEWKELADLLASELRELMRNPLLVDGRNLLDPSEARAAGFVYESIGRASSDLDALPETEEPETQLLQ
jgi:UDPglucose 6-dehydrogenase